jgi:hypothetical protein
MNIRGLVRRLWMPKWRADPKGQDPIIQEVGMRELCVLHVGMHKTGTSSIQSMLYRHLSDERFHYANLDGENQSVPIYSLFCDQPEDYYINRALGWGPEEVAAFNDSNRKSLIEGFKSQRADVVELISGEDIGAMSAAELQRLKEFLDQYFTRIQVIAYIRWPASYIRSALQETIRDGNTRLDLACCDPNYLRFQAFETIFGKENFILRPFIQKYLFGNDVVKDFCHVLGIQYNSSAEPIRDNESISLEALKLLYVFHRFRGLENGPNRYIEKELLVTALRGIGRTKFDISEELYRPILERNALGLRYVEEYMGLRPDQMECAVQDSGGISCENDFLVFSEETIADLKHLVGREWLKEENLGNSPEDIARIVDLLRLKLIANAKDHDAGANPKGSA